MLRSLRNRLTLFFFGITLLAIAALYLYIAPGLQSRLLRDDLRALSAQARQDVGHLRQTVGSNLRLGEVRRRVDTAGAETGNFVTLFLVSETQAGPQLTVQADTSKRNTAQGLAFPTARRAALTGQLTTGTEHTASGLVAEAADPVSYQGRVGAVVVYSNPISDLERSSSIVRRQILVAGLIALLLALAGGYLVARALTLRLKRLERAVEQVAAGDFGHTITVDSSDEIGQLALAFNDMQRQLAQLELARKQFIATASHELRTPIFSLGGFVELLEDEDLDEETRRRFLDQVRDQVERLRKLSVDLLDLSRLEAGSLELRPEQVDIGELTRSVSGEFEPALAQHDAHLELRLSARTIEALCDPVRVAQIVRILIDNAVTHTPPGTRIVVTAGREDGQVRLAVRDDGDGIEGLAVRRIFEPFYTADDAQGSGLGLAIASELAERMAGRLTVSSQPGNTVFTFEIPA